MVALYTCIQEIVISNLGLITGYPDQDFS